MTESDFQTFEAVSALVVVLDLEHRIVYWNRACSDLTGFSLEEVRGRKFDFLLVPDEAEGVKADFAKLRGAEEPHSFANHWVTKSGQQRWLAWSNALIRKPDGVVEYIIKTGIDRTDPERVEEALRTSKARLEGLISLATDAIISIDSQQRIVLYNQGAEKIFGWSAGEVMGRPLGMILPNRFREVHSQHVRQFGTGRDAGRTMAERMPEIFGLRKNGQEFPAQAAISRLDVDGDWLFTVVLRDVTENKRQEKEQKFLAKVGEVLVATLEYDELLASIAGLVVQNLGDLCAIDVVEPDASLQRVKVVHRDPAMTTVCEGLLKVVIERQSPELVSGVLETKQPSLIAEVPSQYLESVAQSEGHLRTLQELAPRSVMVVPLLVRGELLGALTIVSSSRSRSYGPQDLRVAVELALRAGFAIENARLYKEARSYARDLREANQRMVSATIRAQELTDEADAATTVAEQRERKLAEMAEFREMFIGVLGHDLRNPLGAIGLAVSVLRRGGRLDERGEKAVGRIVKSAERMTRMISQLLDLTRARLGGGFPLERKPSDMSVVCRRVAEEFGDSVRLDVEGDVTGSWDCDRVEEALSNLLGNAVEHAAPETPVVLKAYVDGPEVVVEIRNQGDPIPPEVLPFIFEPFRRAKQRESSPTGNLGLGLYIASQIAHSHGGILDAVSSEGTTAFVMRMPRVGPVNLPEAATAPATALVHRAVAVGGPQ